ncbi:MAG: transglutaminase domain-containing protein [Cytophagales bacterium]|nr:transglutaminase domain-containing protein [Cytophagales bacterium]
MYYKQLASAWLLISSSLLAMAQTLSTSGIVLFKKRVLYVRFIDQQIKVIAENTLIIQHGSRHNNISSFERISYTKFNKLLQVKAYTITSAGDTVHVKQFTDQSVAQAGIFYDDYMERTFLFPSVALGSTSHLYYTEELTEPRFLGVYYFNASLPVVHSQFQVYCDKHINMEFSLFNASQVSFKKEKHRDYFIYTWQANHLTPGSSNKAMRYQAPHIIPRITCYSTNTKQKTVCLLATVNDLYAWYSNLIKEVEEQATAPTVCELATNLTAHLSTPVEKAKAIFEWVQQNVHYIAFEDGYGGLVPRKAAEVLQKRYGDCKDMTSLLIALMRCSGIPAYFTWIGTRSLPYRYTELPAPVVDNHMIATIKINDQYIFLDATNPYLPFGLPSSEIQGKEALIGVSRQSYVIHTIPIIEAHQSILFDSATLQLQSRDTVEITGIISGSGYFKSMLNSKKPLLGQRYLKMLNWQHQSLTADSSTVQYKGFIHHHLLKHGNQIYLNPNLITKEYYQQWLPSGDSVELPEFEHTFTLLRQQLILVPQHWQIVSLPSDVVMNYNRFGFCIRYKQQAGGILIHSEVKVNTLAIKAEELALWQQFIQQYDAATRQNIIFQPVY